MICLLALFSMTRQVHFHDFFMTFYDPWEPDYRCSAYCDTKLLGAGLLMS